MSKDDIRRNLYSALERIEKAGGKNGNVTLVAATKTVPAELINEVISAGIKDVGENRVQEYMQKRDLVTGARWHFIGTLQRNKAKYLVGSVELIQSVSGRELAAEIDRLAGLRGVKQRVLAELNAGDEPDKTGAKRADIDGLIEYVRTLPNLVLEGLMAVPPVGAGDDVYRGIRDVFERHAGGTFTTLSVGMSGDYERAIAFGSNMVRLGTAIFGKRN